MSKTKNAPYEKSVKVIKKTAGYKVVLLKQRLNPVYCPKRTFKKEPMCNGKVIFVSQREAETIHPEPGVAMISITDPGKPLAELDSWELIYRDSFFDGGYSEDAIHIHKDEFRMRYCSYIDSEQAEKLKNFISQLISSGVNKIYVHCYFGRSHSGTVAKYLVNQLGFESNKAIESPNMTVYKLLCNPVRFEPLIQQYEQAAEEKQPTISQKFVDLLMVALGLKK